MAAATKKRDARKSLSQPGWITLEGGFAARKCVVQDMSKTGAKITVDATCCLRNCGLLSRAMQVRGDIAKWCGVAEGLSASSLSGSSKRATHCNSI